MEVHAHSHTSRKKWTHYFWEFLMLFLAVFCGFLAENYREHYVEDQRAIKHAKNLYKELYNDSILMTQTIANRNNKEKQCSHYINYVKDSSFTNLSPGFLNSFVTALIQNQYIIFEPNDGILNQLRNSGELRYFKNSELQSELGKLGVKIVHLRTRNDREYSYVESYCRPFVLKHFDFGWYEKLTQNGSLTLVQALQRDPHTTIPGKLINPDTFNRQEAESLVSYYLLLLRSTRQVQYKEYTDANHRVLELLRKEFHFK
jgi:hypothetical protein